MRRYDFNINSLTPIFAKLVFKYTSVILVNYKKSKLFFSIDLALHYGSPKIIAFFIDVWIISI